jgi:hypothetical protein
MGAGEIEGLGRGEASDQAIGDLGCGRERRRVPDAAQQQVAMDLVGNQNQISSTDQTVPPGLCGLQKNTILVRDVSFSASASRSIS